MTSDTCPECLCTVEPGHSAVVRNLLTGREVWHWGCFAARSPARMGDTTELRVEDLDAVRRSEARRELFSAIGAVLGVIVAVAVILAQAVCHKT